MFSIACRAATGAKRAAASTVTTLSAFTANGDAVADGGTKNLVNGTTSCTIVATCTDPNANIGTPSGTISGFTETSPRNFTWSQDSLATGNNAVAFTVTAEDGVTTHDYTLTLHVLTAGVNEITTIDFTGLSGLDFVTAGDGKYFKIFGFDPAPVPIWFNTGTEAQPSVPGASSYYEVVITSLDADTDLAAALAAQVPTMAAVGAVTTWTSDAVGARIDAVDVNAGVAIVVTQQGVDPV